MMTICFQTMSGNGNARRICQMNQNSTVQDLFQQATYSLLGSVDFLKFGFPSQILRLGDSNKDVLIKDLGIANQEKIVVSLLSEAKTSQVTDADAKQSSTPNSSSNKVNLVDNIRPRRKAAALANESIIEASKLIKASEEAFKKQKRANHKPMTPETKAKLATARHFRTVEAVSSARRLHDGALVGQKKIARSPSSVHGATNVEEALMTSFGSRSRGARLLRHGWKQAVNSMYEQNQSVARVASIEANTAEFEIVKNDTTSAQSLHVTYPKGIQGRSDQRYEDIVSELIDIDALKEVVRMICNSDSTPEALRPSNLALLSPRVFWCLHYHYRNNQHEQEHSMRNHDATEAALRWLHPTFNWSYLCRRATKLSAKAQENLRQKQESTSNDSTSNWEAAVSAIESVEQAMAKMYDDQSSENNVDTGTIGFDKLDWALETPDEHDVDELIECISKSSMHEKFTSNNVALFASLLLEKCTIRNWRELANAQAESLYSTLKRIEFSAPELTVADVDSWIDYAQERSIEEIMYEICDNDDDAIELLEQAANSGTPKDLSCWSLIVPTLHKELEDFIKQDSRSIHVPTRDQLKKWCQKSEIVLNQLDWLNFYTTPIG